MDVFLFVCLQEESRDGEEEEIKPVMVAGGGGRQPRVFTVSHAEVGWREMEYPTEDRSS